MRVVYGFSNSDPNGGGSSVDVVVHEYGDPPTDQELRDLGDYLAANLTMGPGQRLTTTLVDISRHDLIETISLNT